MEILKYYTKYSRNIGRNTVSLAIYHAVFNNGYEGSRSSSANRLNNDLRRPLLTSKLLSIRRKSRDRKLFLAANAATLRSRIDRV